MSHTHVVILAAGKGTRMKSAHPKVLHRVGGLSLIEHVLRSAAALDPDSTVVIVGHQAERVRQTLGKRMGLRFATQEPQLGTGHALLQAARLGPRPQLIRIETRAGHGSGKPTDKAIEEGTDILAFLAQWTGLKLP